MKRRSNTTTAILVIALLGGVAFVSAAFNPPPPAPPAPAKTDTGQQVAGGAAANPTPAPADGAKAPDKPIQPPKAAQEQMAKQMREMQKTKKTVEDLMPKAKLNPTMIDVSPEGYREYNDGSKGEEEMAKRMAIQAENIKKARKTLASKVPEPSKGAQEMMIKQAMEAHPPGSGH